LIRRHVRAALVALLRTRFPAASIVHRKREVFQVPLYLFAEIPVLFNEGHDGHK
jgi:hypothetical protein